MNPDIQRLIENTTSFILAIGTIYGAYKFIKIGFFKPFFKFVYNFIDSVNSHPLIKQQLLPNGGSSLVDKVSRIEMRQCISDGMDKAVLSKINAILFQSDKHGKCIEVSKAYLDFTGKQKEDLLDNGWLNIISEEDRDRVWEEWNTTLEQEREYSSTYKMIDRHGKPIKVNCKAFVVHGPNSEVLRYIGLIEQFQTV